MKRLLAALSISLLLAGCVTPSALQPSVDDLKPDNLRAAIAKELLQTAAFGSVSLIKAKIINARISAPSEEHTLFSKEPYTHYCVTAFIENPLFPIHQAAYGEIEITGKDGKRSIHVRTRTTNPCSGTNFEPYPEIEQLSLRRYEQS
jgi:hypothetical protein